MRPSAWWGIFKMKNSMIRKTLFHCIIHYSKSKHVSLFLAICSLSVFDIADIVVSCWTTAHRSTISGFKCFATLQNHRVQKNRTLYINQKVFHTLQSTSNILVSSYFPCSLRNLKFDTMPFPSIPASVKSVVHVFYEKQKLTHDRPDIGIIELPKRYDYTSRKM